MDFEKSKRNSIDMISLVEEMGLIHTAVTDKGVEANLQMTPAMAVCMTLTGALNRINCEIAGIDAEEHQLRFWNDGWQSLPPEIRDTFIDGEHCRQVFTQLASLLSVKISLSIAERMGLGRSEMLEDLGGRWREELS